MVSASILSQLAVKVAPNWKKLVSKLGLSKDEVAAIEKEKEDEKGREKRNEQTSFGYHITFLPGRAELMFKKWSETEGEGATHDELLYILEGLKMKDVAEGLLVGSTAS